jgi:DNA-directed RNA polymerase alpha subunit/DNA-directed RNA polymerase subunit L
MNTQLNNFVENLGILHFTLSNINVSLSNAIRRIILSEIPTIAFITEIYVDNQCNIEINTSRLHNEILKQRLGCIPIHEKVVLSKELSDPLSGKYIMELDVNNDTENLMYVTTEHFKIKNKSNGHYLTQEERNKIFPKDPVTHYYIDFLRLRPKISDTIPGEHIKLSCEFLVSTAKNNSMYNVVSKCAYSNTIDVVKKNTVWDSMYEKLKEVEENSKDEIEFQKRNFEALDAQRCYIPNSFDFVIKSVGVYENIEIVKMSLIILQNKFVDLIKDIDADVIVITQSESTIENCYDIVLENEDYTMGKVLEYLLYSRYYEKEKKLTYCGFKKYHPHDTYSIIRLGLEGTNEKSVVRQYIRSACVESEEIFRNIYKLF